MLKVLQVHFNATSSFTRIQVPLATRWPGYLDINLFQGDHRKNVTSKARPVADFP